MLLISACSAEVKGLHTPISGFYNSCKKLVSVLTADCWTQSDAGRQGPGARGSRNSLYALARDVSSMRRQSAGQSVFSNMAGVLFEDIFNVKDIDPEGKKFDRGESIWEFTFRRVRLSTCRGDARTIFIARMTVFLSRLATRELSCPRRPTLPIAPARRAHGTWLTAEYPSIALDLTKFSKRISSAPLRSTQLAITANGYNVN